MSSRARDKERLAAMGREVPSPPVGRPPGGSLVAQALSLWGRMPPWDKERFLAEVTRGRPSALPASRQEPS
jgi:hypothetical protein